MNTQETLDQKMARLRTENPLSPAITSHYTLEGLIPGKISFGGRPYDLRKISKAKADELVKAGFPNLKPKTASAAAASSQETDKKSK